MKSLFFFLLLTHCCLAQQLQQIATVPMAVDSFIGVDSYKNFYSITNRELHKDGPDGNFMHNDLQLGKISSVDIINPLKLVLFYQDTNTVLFLDNKLSEIDRINFTTIPDFINVSTATNAGNNKLWVFNIDSQQLEFYNYRTNEKVVVSQPFPGKLNAQASNFNYCFTLTDQKLRAFNIYGSLLQEIAINGFEKIVQQNENVFALKENAIYLFSNFANTKVVTELEPIKLQIPEITIKDLHRTDEYLYIYDGKNLHTFTLTIPK